MGFLRDAADLIAEVRSLADMQNTQAVTDDEINLWLNSAYRELYNMLLNTYEMYKIDSDDIAMVTDQKDYDLPTDFLKLVKVFWVGTDGREYPLTRMTLHETDVYDQREPGPRRYLLIGSKIRFWPIPSAGRTIRIYYNPAATVFAKTDTDIDFEQHQDEFCIVSAVVKCLEKEGTPVAEQIAERERLRQQCKEIVAPRDVSAPTKITDVVYGRDRDYWERGWL